MGRTAKVILYGSSYKIVTDLDEKIQGKSCNEIWDYLFTIYILDDEDRLVYAEQFHGGPKGIRNEIQTITSNMHKSEEEIFDKVEILRLETQKVLKILEKVNLIGILEGIKEVFDEEIRANNQQRSNVADRT